MSDAYDKIDRFLRNNLDDDDYNEYSTALDEAIAATPAQSLDALLDPYKAHIERLLDALNAIAEGEI